jgi:hypothetical protein
MQNPYRVSILSSVGFQTWSMWGILMPFICAMTECCPKAEMLITRGQFSE